VTATPAPSAPRRLRRPGRAARAILALAVAVVVAVAAYGAYAYYSGLPPPGETTLVIYTYPSLLGGTDCNPTVYATVFGTFEAAYHVHIVLECPAGTLLSTLISQEGSAGADLVIGLDELTTPVAEADGLLVPYAPPALANVSPELVGELSPDHGAVPYEYGYLAIDFNTSFAASTGGAVAHATFPEFTSNATWARGLLTENPEYDITGEEFLVWQIEYYEDVLHQNWEGFWTDLWGEGLPNPAPDWGTAFDEFSTPGGPPMVVSYSTDPAYAAANGAAGTFNSTVSWWNGTEYGWRTIYGVGIVKGSPHLSLDEAFENWFLNGTVQAQIPENEWEYPANTTVALPAVFSAALDPATIVPLNAGVTPTEVAAQLPGWVSSWLALVPGST
jgi:thiamine transport system substrate-binding protein